MNTEYIVFLLAEPLSQAIDMFSSSGVGRPGHLCENGEQPRQKEFWKQTSLRRPVV